MKLLFLVFESIRVGALSISPLRSESLVTPLQDFELKPFSFALNGTEFSSQNYSLSFDCTPFLTEHLLFTGISSNPCRNSSLQGDLSQIEAQMSSLRIRLGPNAYTKRDQSITFLLRDSTNQLVFETKSAILCYTAIPMRQANPVIFSDLRSSQPVMFLDQVFASYFPTDSYQVNSIPALPESVIIDFQSDSLNIHPTTKIADTTEFSMSLKDPKSGLCSETIKIKISSSPMSDFKQGPSVIWLVLLILSCVLVIVGLGWLAFSLSRKRQLMAVQNSMTKPKIENSSTTATLKKHGVLTESIVDWNKRLQQKFFGGKRIEIKKEPNISLKMQDPKEEEDRERGMIKPKNLDFDELSGIGATENDQNDSFPDDLHF